jgi:predicted nucleic acid-binding protein
VTPITRDPNDDYLIALARGAGVDAIVSGDADLLALERADPAVVSPSRLVEQLARSE